MESKTLVLLLVCSVFCVAAASHHHHHSGSSGGGSSQSHSEATEASTGQSFDFFYFVQQWPGSYCDTSKGCCFPISGAPKAVFGIHGLWPNYNDGTYPTNCGSEAYDESTDLLATMDDDWGSLACPSSDSESFWEHEWSKHGTCTTMTQHQYFQAGINLYSNYDITGALANAGIVPDGSEYHVGDMQNAIASILDGHLPGIECNKDQDHDKQIYQVYICVSTDGSTLIDCPVLPSNECKGTVEFPPFDPSSLSSSSRDFSKDLKHKNDDAHDFDASEDDGRKEEL